MKTSGEIRFDYENALTQASRLEELANNIQRRVVRPMDSTAQDLHAAWTGTSANDFIRKEQDLRGQVAQTEQDLRDIASDIRTIARRLYNAEMDALRVAQSLFSH